MFVGISAHCFGATWTAKMQTATLFKKASPQPCHFFCPTASIEANVRAAEMMSQRIVMPPKPRGMHARFHLNRVLRPMLESAFQDPGSASPLEF